MTENRNSEQQNRSKIPKVHTDDEVYTALVEAFGRRPESAEPDSGVGRVLISAPYMMPNISAFKRFFQERGHRVLVAEVEERLEEEDLQKFAGRYDVALIGDDRYTPSVLQNCGAKALSKWGTGIDSIDLKTAERLGIRVHNTPNAFSEPVAESILGAILAFNRTLMQSNHLMQDPEQLAWAKVPGRTLSEVRIGIVGLGNVGRCLLRKLVALGGCRDIFTYDILGRIDLDPATEQHPCIQQFDSLEELLLEGDGVDFLCLCCCQTEENVGMIGAMEFAMLPSHTVIINMARGRLINEQHLIHELQKERLGGAALDVFWDEPLAQDSPLRSMPNVLLTSHNANSSPACWQRIHINTIRNALSYLEG